MADESGNDKDVLPKIYTKAGVFSEYNKEWDFDNNKNDIIFINLGSNDCKYVMSEPKIRDDAFIQEYANFEEIKSTELFEIDAKHIVLDNVILIQDYKNLLIYDIVHSV